MKKKIFKSLILAVIMVFTTNCSVFASVDNVKTLDTTKKISFTKDTIITKDNVYEIIEYYGLDKSAVKEEKNNESFEELTVGEFENILNEAKNIPTSITTNNIDNEISPVELSPIETNPLAAGAETGIKTVTSDSSVCNGSCNVRYSCSGEYYKNGSTKYWTKASGGASLQMLTGQVGNIYYSIDSITTLNTTLLNGSTSNSKLELGYCYAIGTYTGIKGLGGVRVASTCVTGANYYNNSYL